MIVDASVWVAGILVEDKHHESSLECMRRFVMRGHMAIVPALVWPEIAGAIARRSGDKERGLMVARFIASQGWVQSAVVDATLAGEAMRLAAELCLRGADAVYVALASMRRMPLLTLDAEMRERAGTIVEVLTPEQWLEHHS